MKKTSYLFGSKSLLIQCYKVLQSHDFAVNAVVSDDKSIRTWAESLNIPVYKVSEQEQLEDLGEVDYIFSITHLRIIPSNVLKLAKTSAINFHDGVLPGYAGLNVTTWALYNQEKSHGVTWHEMTDDVDEGRILKQTNFELDELETAFTLNAKCYESALSSFTELMSDLVQDKLEPQVQDAAQSAFYKACQRLPALSALDWRLTAEKLEAEIRALNFGPYANPMSLPKILFNDAVFFVQEAEIKTVNKNHAAGEIVAVTDSLDVAASNGVISFKKLFDVNGKDIALADVIRQTSVQVGDVLPIISEQDAAQLTSYDEQVCRQETRWLNALQRNNQLELSLLNNPADDAAVYENLPQSIDTLATQHNAEELQSLLVLFFARLTCQSAFDCYFNYANKTPLANLLIENCVPVDFAIDFEQPVPELIKSTSENIHKPQNMLGYGKDLLSRYPELHIQPADKKLVFMDIGVDTDEINSIDCSLLLQLNENNSEINWRFKTTDFNQQKIQELQNLFAVFVDNISANPQANLSAITLLSTSDYEHLVHQLNQTEVPYQQSSCIHHLFEEQVQKTPSSIALSFAGKTLSYDELNQQANKIAYYLISTGIQADQLVGVLLDRSVDMIAAMMGILKAGAAYLPLDPTYPKDRIDYMLEDGEVVAVITQREHASHVDNLAVTKLFIDEDQETLSSYPDTNPQASVGPQNLSYTIYTSGSTGKPKGVMVEHGNVVNFFHGMSQTITDPQGVWLAVTSISFDISVLEIFWTLANGYEVALYADAQRKKAKKTLTAYPDQDIEFSLFYWNVADDESEYDDDAYRLLLESAKYGDRNNFKAVWTPERHFHSFGGLYPNPSVTSAALAAVTENIHIRAGSCVIPLHHPIRVAEDWSMIDNISHGRVGLAIAAGWQPNDFVIMPQNHADAKNVMFESVETVQKLWRGETLEFPGPKGDMVKVKTLPRPIQETLPIWVTTAGNPETFRQAGETGANILTHLLGQTVEQVAENIKIYREAYKAAGFEGEGHVTLLLHTLVGNDDEKVKELARAPMKKYLKSAMFLVKAAAWHFPTFKDFSEESGKTLDDFFETISDEDFDAILEFAFLRYYETSGLFGTPERCLAMVDRVKEIGVNEIGCLIDYGLDTDNVLAHLPALNELRKISIQQSSEANEQQKEQSIAEIIEDRNVTHLQCTPSMASMLVADEENAQQLQNIQHMMVGGEALSLNLAQALTSKVQQTVTNMYGPTETTIWSTTQNIHQDDEKVFIGKPISNTQVYILDKFKQPVPKNVAGELHIAGAGVVRGYHQREALTDERFIPNPFVDDENARMYCTGDLVQYTDTGAIEYLGRIDQQIKMRGYRIELGEIESLLLQSDSVAEAVVMLREDTPNDKRLVAYIKTSAGSSLDQEKLKSLLANDLPEFMVPGIFIEMNEFPLTPNNKIDRLSLPVPEQVQQAVSKVSFVKPENELQEQIVATWREALNIEKIGLDDNFFDIGGHSLLVVEVLAGLREHIDKPIKMTDMFRFPTIRQFSNYLSADDEPSKKLSDSQDRAVARKSARKTAINRRRARQK